MRQLTGLDAQFLALESDRQYGHVSGLAILDPSTRRDGKLDIEDVRGMIANRLPQLPPFRWRLKTVPLDLDYPYWVDDEDFDLCYHVRDMALAQPATEAKLAEQVARIFSRPLDRTRPLWECYLIQGLPDDRVAVLTKIHHSVVDGMSGAEILGVLLDLQAEPEEDDPSEQRQHASAGRAPDTVEMLARAMIGAPRYAARVISRLPSSLPLLDQVAILDAIPGLGQVSALSRGLRRAMPGRSSPSRVLGRSTLKPPNTSFNGRVSPHRRFAFGQLSLSDVKEVKNAYGCTVNDVVLCICAGAVRRWLLAHKELPEDPLVTQVPVSVRTVEDFGTYGNRIGMMSTPLFTNEPDPVQRLLMTHEAMKVAKEIHQALPATLLQDAAEFIPPAVFARASRVQLSLAAVRKPIWNLVVSNVPGPQVPLYLAGAKLEANYPVSVITDGMGLNITVMSYCGRLDFGIVADREQMPDLWKLIGWLGDSLRELQDPIGTPAEEPEPAIQGA